MGDELSFTVVDEASFDDIPAPAAPGARCQTCDYWERQDGHREASESSAAHDLKLSRLMGGARVAGAHGMLARRTDATGARGAVGWAQFGPLAAYPRALSIRERYAKRPDSPAPWVVTCLQIAPRAAEREVAGAAPLRARGAELGPRR